MNPTNGGWGEGDRPATSSPNVEPWADDDGFVDEQALSQRLSERMGRIKHRGSPVGDRRRTKSNVARSSTNDFVFLDDGAESIQFNKPVQHVEFRRRQRKAYSDEFLKRLNDQKRREDERRASKPALVYDWQKPQPERLIAKASRSLKATFPTRRRGGRERNMSRTVSTNSYFLLGKFDAKSRSAGKQRKEPKMAAPHPRTTAQVHESNEWIGDPLYPSHRPLSRDPSNYIYSSSHRNSSKHAPPPPTSGGTVKSRSRVGHTTRRPGSSHTLERYRVSTVAHSALPTSVAKHVLADRLSKKYSVCFTRNDLDTVKERHGQELFDSFLRQQCAHTTEQNQFPLVTDVAERTMEPTDFAGDKKYTTHAGLLQGRIKAGSKVTVGNRLAPKINLVDRFSYLSTNKEMERAIRRDSVVKLLTASN